MRMSFINDNTDTIKEIAWTAREVALEAVGLQAEGYAKRLCAVDTGRLRNSITHTADDDTAYIGTNVEYAPYVEYGTIHMKAQPFLKPAANDHVDEYKEIFQYYLENA
jgi:HK97 gp10 family phage protein